MQASPLHRRDVIHEVSNDCPAQLHPAVPAAVCFSLPSPSPSRHTSGPPAVHRPCKSVVSSSRPFLCKEQDQEEEETNWKSRENSPASPDHISRCPSASRLPLATWRRGPPWPSYKRRSSPPHPGRHRHGCSLRPDGGPCRYPFREFSKSVPRHGSHRPWLPRCDSSSPLSVVPESQLTGDAAQRSLPLQKGRLLCQWRMGNGQVGQDL